MSTPAHSPAPGALPMELDRRAIRLPIGETSPVVAGRLLALVRALEGADGAGAEAVVGRLQVACERASASQRISALRALALGSTLVDLARAGWEISIDEGDVYALAPRGSRAGRGHEAAVEAKARVRALALVGVRRQLADPGERRFVRDAEAGGVARLIARGPALAEALGRQGADAVQPYLQLASSDAGIEPETGLPRYSVWRYFRYLWSFPRGDVPGRSLPFLVRDAGQPGHPVCGLLAISSPVLQLSARDLHLGLNTAWVEAAFRCLDVDLPEELGEARAHLVATLRGVLDPLERRRTLPAGGLRPEQVLRDLCASLRVEPSARPEVVARRLLVDGLEAARGRLEGALHRLATALVQDSVESIASVSTDGLGVSADALVEDPGGCSETLGALAAREHEARQAALERRSALAAEGQGGAARAAKAEADEHLYVKKRATRLAHAARSWAALAPIRAALAARERDPGALRNALRAAILGASERTPAPAWSNGARCSAAVRAAVNGHRVAVISAQVVDVSVCGAIPPYDGLLGGKLVALLALSREVAAAYHDAYAERASEISSRMAGHAVTRSTSLLALTTTSLYSVGSAQYNRARLPDALGGVGWREVGRTRGYGTMHFSAETSERIVALLEVDRGAREVNSTFGEGPSERLRKLRMGLEFLGLPASDLLQHGEGRIVYVADLGRATPIGLSDTASEHRLVGPSVADITAHWRARWLTPRLGEPDRLARLRAVGIEAALVRHVHAGALSEGEE